MNTKSNKQIGSALLTVLVLIFVMSLSVGAIHFFATSSAHASRKSTESIKSHIISEAGAHLAFSLLKENYELRFEREMFNEQDFMDGSYSVYLDPLEDGRTFIHSRGVYRDTATDLILIIADTNIYNPTNQNNYFDFLGFSLFSNGDIRFNGTPPFIDSNIHANNNWTLNGSYENISSSVRISARNGDDIPDEYRAAYREVSFPSWSDPEFQKLLNENDVNYYIGNQTFHKDFDLTGIHIVQGDLTLRGSGDYNINGMLYVSGDIASNGSGRLNLNGIMMAGGSITFNGASGVFDRNSSVLDEITQLDQNQNSSTPNIQILSWSRP